MAHQTEAIRELVKRVEGKLGRYTNSSHAQALMMEQRRILSAVEGIANIRENPNSLETPAANVLRLVKSANKLKEESAKIKQKTYQTYAAYITQIESAIHDRAGIKQNEYSQEIRAQFRTLDSKERLKFIENAVDNNDGATFAAIMLAPEVLTGVPRDMNIKLSENFYKRAAPDLYQEREDVKEAIDGVLASIDTAAGIANEYDNADARRNIENEVQKAQEAASQFNAAMTTA